MEQHQTEYFQHPKSTISTLTKSNTYRIKILQEDISKNVEPLISPILDTAKSIPIVNFFLERNYPGLSGSSENAKSAGSIVKLWAPVELLGSPREIVTVGSWELVGKIQPPAEVSFLIVSTVREESTLRHRFVHKLLRQRKFRRDRELFRYHRLLYFHHVGTEFR